MFTVCFTHATTTPSQPGLSQLVEAALADCGAERTGLEAEIRLSDGALLYMFGEDAPDGMLAEYPVLTPAIAAALLAVLRRTNSFMLDGPGGRLLVRPAGNVGEPRTPLMYEVELREVEDADALTDLLKGLRNNRSTTPSRPQSSPSRTPARAKPGFSITDFLFGKAV
ncbi:hypothetical protein [Brevundimonas nasdae]|uniref:Uncharacterized protein n=1 Tax=Brevundimonas nasdae TaxID=172043 RepID=A0ABX8TCL4_9CAUL|nr:hypothetical protein [Brevundimonas nasdae]QYC08921.1 hypothetical protein KWG56_09720 [Brevundimonas nasdae]QYC14971.1 hypothetical protein KWG63_05055 [Brevundimonas nasdae]